MLKLCLYSFAFLYLLSASMMATSTQFKQKEVTIQSDDIILAGTLSLPQQDQKKPLPAVLILVGARPWDRNGNIKGSIPFGHYKDIADYLASQGFIILRYDKRGIGKSTGKFPPDEFLLSQDALASFHWLREQSQVNKNKMVIIAHSQGTRIASIIASRVDGLAAVVLLAPVINTKDANSYKCPVLLVGGLRDKIVSPKWVDKLIKAFHNAGNKNCRSLLVPGADHLFFDISQGKPDYTHPSTTIHPLLLKEMAAWLEEMLSK